MKIVIVTHRFIKNDGQGRVNYEIARAASRAGHSVHLIATSAADDLLSMPNVKWTPVSQGPFPTQLMRNIWFSQASAPVVASASRTADAVLVNGPVTRAQGTYNAVHFIHSCWRKSPYFKAGKGVHGIYHRAYALANGWREVEAFKRAQTFIAVSSQVASELTSLGIPPKKITVVTNGVDTEEFFPQPRPRQPFGLPDDQPLALFTGDIASQRKNLDLVLEALLHLPKLALAVVGSLKRSPYPQLVRKMGLSDRVFFLGFRTDIAAIMQCCDVFVFPSRYEACSVVLLEAMASGLPVVTTRLTGGEELVPKNAGFKINTPDDLSGLISALTRLTEEPHLRRSMGQIGRQTALAHTWSQTGENYLRLFLSGAQA